MCAYPIDKRENCVYNRIKKLAGVTDMLKRKIYDALLDWKRTKSRECLLVKGARQIGKTYIIEKFGMENYKHYIYLNFYKNPEHKAIFEGSLDAQEIRKYPCI